MVNISSSDRSVTVPNLRAMAKAVSDAADYSRNMLARWLRYSTLPDLSPGQRAYYLRMYNSNKVHDLSYRLAASLNSPFARSQS